MRSALLLALVACGGSTRAPDDLSHHETGPVSVVDTDDDGVPDDRDGCPTAAEDYDLFNDADGCPDLDDDHDGVPDAKDLCFDLPGKDGEGCPEGCTIMTSITDCFFITPIWTASMPTSELVATKHVFDEYPEIRTVTLTAATTAGEAPEIAHRRAAQAKRALVAAGVPEAKLALDPKLMERQVGGDVFGQITKQRFESGQFRSSHCAGGVGTVYRVEREHNYNCRPVICGDGICYHATEDDGSCPKDCPP